MELELGLKITRIRDDYTSADLRIAKDRAGTLFLSRETEAMFILTAHLRGFRREKIKISINEDGSRIEIRGEKPVQEMSMVGWRLFKKEVEIRGFKKVFRIPVGVVLDRIKAKFNDEEGILTILMPKSVKGLRGVGMEEVASETTQCVIEEVPGRESITKTLEQESKEAEIKDMEETKQFAETSSQVAAETERKGEIGEATPKKVKFLPTNMTYPKTAMVEKMKVEPAERELDGKEEGKTLPSEETQDKELVDLGGQKNKGEIPRYEGRTMEEESIAHDHGTESADSTKNVRGHVIQPSESLKSPSTKQTKVEERTTDEISGVVSEMPQEESLKHETGKNVQEAIKRRKQKEEVEQSQQRKTLHPGQHIESEEVHGREETQGIGNGIQAETTEKGKLPEETKVDERKSPEGEKTEGPDDQATGLRHFLKNRGLLVGSAFLVSLAMVGVGLTRAKKQTK